MWWLLNPNNYLLKSGPGHKNRFGLKLMWHCISVGVTLAMISYTFSKQCYQLEQFSQKQNLKNRNDLFVYRQAHLPAFIRSVSVNSECQDFVYVSIFDIITMAYCKTAISPLLAHCRYCSLALIHRYEADLINQQQALKPYIVATML